MKTLFAGLAACVCAAGFSCGALAADDKAQAAGQLQLRYAAAKAECDKLPAPRKNACMNKAKADHDAAVKKLKGG